MILSFHNVGPREETQVIRVDSRYLCPLSHLMPSFIYLFIHSFYQSDSLSVSLLGGRHLNLEVKGKLWESVFPSVIGFQGSSSGLPDLVAGALTQGPSHWPNLYYFFMSPNFVFL